MKWLKNKTEEVKIQEPNRDNGSLIAQHLLPEGVS